MGNFLCVFTVLVVLSLAELMAALIQGELMKVIQARDYPQIRLVLKLSATNWRPIMRRNHSS